MEHSKFTRRNEGFICENCGISVPPAGKTCRNHCPVCLHSKHVDRFPGDRANPCQGLLKPVNYELHSKKGLMILFSCIKCGETTRNLAICDDANAPDDYDRILSLSSLKYGKNLS